MDEKELSIVVENINECAAINGYSLTSNAERIAKAKLRFFGLGEWYRCPCYPPSDIEHGCGKMACAKEIDENGVCHCNLFKKLDE